MSIEGYFTPIDSALPIRAILVGAGHMGRRWLEAIDASDDVELVGIVDLNLEAARSAAENAGLSPDAVGTDVAELGAQVHADAVINVTVVNAHYPVTLRALDAGLAVLGEKPVAATLDEALVMAASARANERLFMVSQSRSYHRGLRTLQEAVATLGPVGDVTASFFRSSDFGGFRNEMDSPLLIDMAIHAFDAARYLTGQDPVSVYAEEHNPVWSWYQGAASATAVFTLADDTRFVYTGSWCAPGLETPWNGRWRVSAQHGSALWDGEQSIEVARAAGELVEQVTVGMLPQHEGVAGALAEFASALRSGEVPRGDVHENLYSLAMVDAAVTSTRTGTRCEVGELLSEAFTRASESERTPTTLRDLLEIPEPSRAAETADSRS